MPTCLQYPFTLPTTPSPPKCHRWQIFSPNSMLPSPPQQSTQTHWDSSTTPWHCTHQPKGDHASWQWATQPLVSSNMFQTSMSIISHHRKTRGKDADVSCLSSVTIATLIYKKQGFAALHAILVKKRISLTSLPHSITKKLLQIREIAFCLKALFGIMVTLAPIYCTFLILASS